MYFATGNAENAERRQENFVYIKDHSVFSCGPCGKEYRFRPSFTFLRIDLNSASGFSSFTAKMLLLAFKTQSNLTGNAFNSAGLSRNVSRSRRFALFRS